MHQDVKQHWLVALRSDEFRPGTGALRPDEHSYCPLGILCELHRRVVGGRWERTDAGYCYLGKRGIPPQEVMEWAGLLRYPYVSFNGERASISQIHDRLSIDYREIANLIEAQL
jgi:hypothetical protein